LTSLESSLGPDLVMVRDDVPAYIQVLVTKDLAPVDE